MEESNRKCCCEDDSQTHVHEFLGSTRLAEFDECPHNHRFAGISSEVIPIGSCQHVHAITAKTDFYEDHFHEICVRSGPAIHVCEEKHVHFVCGTSTEVEDHEHKFILATLIEDPIG